MLSEDTEEVNFMEKAKQVVEGREVFRCPSRTDQCDISHNYVFAVSILLQPSSSSGWTFCVTRPQNLSAMYANCRKSFEPLDWRCSVHVLAVDIFCNRSHHLNEHFGLLLIPDLITCGISTMDWRKTIFAVQSIHLTVWLHTSGVWTLHNVWFYQNGSRLVKFWSIQRKT